MAALMDEVLVDAETGEAYREVRPSEPMARGLLDVPAWAVLAALGLCLVVVFGGLLRILRRSP